MFLTSVDDSVQLEFAWVYVKNASNNMVVIEVVYLYLAALGP